MQRLARRERTCATREGLLHIMQIQAFDAPQGGKHRAPQASKQANPLVGRLAIGPG